MKRILNHCGWWYGYWLQRARFYANQDDFRTIQFALRQKAMELLRILPEFAGKNISKKWRLEIGQSIRNGLKGGAE